jgi:hypothetical protein
MATRARTPKPSRAGGQKRSRQGRKNSRASRESRGLALLAEAMRGSSPFETARTQYYILGDGRACPALAAVRAAAVVPPAHPIVSIDPTFHGVAKFRTAGRFVKFEGRRAESHRFDRAALAGVDNIVIVAIGAHTPAYKFVARARQAAGPRARLYAVCSPCCFPGLRAPTETIHAGPRWAKWQLLWPRGQAATARRPLRAAEERRAANWAARRVLWHGRRTTLGRVAATIRKKRVASPKRGVVRKRRAAGPGQGAAPKRRVPRAGAARAVGPRRAPRR